MPRGLLAAIRRVHAASGGVYSQLKIWDELRDEDIMVARCTVERLMRAHGLEGLRNSLVKRTTLPGLSPVAAEDLVRRNFTACRPDAVWLSDIERHEALFYRVEVNGLHLRVVAATCPKLRAA